MPPNATTSMNASAGVEACPADRRLTDKASTAAAAAASWRLSAVGGASAALAAVPRPAAWWTGKRPEECAGWDASEGVLRSLPLVDLSASSSREALLDYFDNTWTLTEVLFSGLVGEEAFFVPPVHRLRHPLVFYYGHVAALYVNKLRVAGALERSVDADLECVLETGVDEMSWDDMSKNESVWPTLERVHAYRRTVYGLVRDFILAAPSAAPPIGMGGHPGWALAMSFEHERIHIETSSVLMRELPARLLERPSQWPAVHPAARAGAPPREEPLAAARFVAVPGGAATLGKPRDFPSFGWDNEYGQATINVPAFEVHDRLTSNGEFLEFVKAGGYSERSLWSEDGWGWRTYRNAKWPTFWTPVGPQGLHEYELRTTHESTALRLDLPAVVNRHEAHAYCTWLARREGKPDGAYRLPAEAEYALMRQPYVDDAGAGASDFPVAFGGAALRACAGAPNAQLAHGSESPVDAETPNALGLRGVRGNVWQWCADWFSGMPGFAPHPLYDDFSSPCFDGEHSVIMGGSWVSTGDLCSDFARFHFRPHFFQHAGFRVCRAPGGAGGAVPPVSHVHSRGPFAAGWRPSVESAGGSGSADSTGKGYETQELVNMYLGLHYGSAADVCDAGLLSAVPGVGSVADFPRRCAAETMRVAEAVGALVGGAKRALDVGCATGGASFAFAERFEEVVGVDLSRAFVSACNTLKETGEAEYQRPLEGQLTDRMVARVPASAEQRARCTFRVMDACCLSPDLGTFDCVLLGNLLCRLPSPKACLGRMGGDNGLVKVGGVLFITTPFTWLEACTPLTSWLGGFVDESSGEPKLSVDGLRDMMSAIGFEMVEEKALPLIIRETSRKYQLIASTATAWKRVR